MNAAIAETTNSVWECAQPYTSNTDTCVLIKINTQWGLEPDILCPSWRKVSCAWVRGIANIWSKKVWSSTVESAAVYFEYRDSYTLLQIHSLIDCHVSSVRVEPEVFTFDPRGTDVRMYTRCPRTYTKANINIRKAHRGYIWDLYINLPNVSKIFFCFEEK